ncbi:MAG: outer membrane beta-barrel protein, partial [Muribaculaceae bacterium]
MMKIRFALLASLMAIAAGNAQGAITKGCVIDEKKTAIEYATIVLSQNGTQKYGGTSDDSGCFSLDVEQGRYALKVAFVGYETYTDTINVPVGGIDLGEIMLKNSGVALDEVTVTASLIRRESDRYVMDVEDQPVTIGKNGEEMLRQAPGVFVQRDKITINGKGGVKVYINDREIQNMTEEQLLAYLRSLRAEDMSKIEVIPNSGAEFSADSQSGIIRIYTKKNRDNGTMGAVGLSSNLGWSDISFSPNFNISHHNNRITFNLDGSLGFGVISRQEMLSHTEYATGTVVDDNTLNKSKGPLNSERIGFGATYDINSRSSIGAEINFYGNQDSGNSSLSSTFEKAPGRNYILEMADTVQDGVFRSWNPRINYRLKLDTLGSTLKVIATYTDNMSRDYNDYRGRRTLNGTALPDSVYKNNSESLNRTFTLTADLDKTFNSRWKMQAGVRYALNDMNSKQYFAHENDNLWIVDEYNTFDVNYRENIYAAYATGAFHSGRWNLKAGGRAEYARCNGEGFFPTKNYFDFFPSASAMYMFNDLGSYSVSASYNRNIQRPSFWALNPNRRIYSPYASTMGNPDLKPAYHNSIGLNFTLAYKYALYANYTFSNNGIMQVTEPDSKDPQMVTVTFKNLAKDRYFVMGAYLPFTITKWWNITLNASYYYHKE